ncbi:hypothetical protein [Kineosporia babensis]|uniref:Lipoprotein n=1 Tax=Kineosporia babensis TaxID=499548 RepID=A0A9X1N9P3_9ACTN|nr:hypothetical protein [Kineosporia babensis]MCD5309276.1 hypothetical protein [Kineosporia babensis]
MKRTRVVAAKTALAAGVVALGLTGCSVTNPAVIKDPYPASDGIDADLPGTQVLLRNLIVIGAEQGAEAELIGSVINNGTEDARVSIQAAVGETGQPSQTTVAVAAGQAVQFGPGSNQTPVSISALAVPPGNITGLTASTSSGGRIDLNVPVLPPEGDYASVTPAASPTGSAGATEDATAGQGETATEDEAATGDETATEEAGEESTPTSTNNSKRKQNQSEDETAAEEESAN